MNIVIAGGTGALGQHLTRHYSAQGHYVTVLTRGPNTTIDDRVHHVHWDAQTQGDWGTSIHNADTIINLAGKLVDCRPTRKNIKALTDSRVNATLTLAQAINKRTNPLPTLIQASTTAIYGNRGNQHLTETSPIGTGPAQMVDVAQPWEQAATAIHAHHHHTLRTSIVLQPNTPALNRLTLLAHLGAAGTIGNGKQWFSWIHIDDWTNIVDQAINGQLPTGTINATSPNPITNKQFMKALRTACQVKLGLPTPALAVKIGGYAMGTDPALALTGRRVTSEHLPAEMFQHPEILEALSDVISRG